MYELYRRFINAIIQWLVSHLPKSVREPLIEQGRKEVAQQKYHEVSDFCKRTNIHIMEQLLKYCPDHHLIVIERSCGWPGPSFEEDKEHLLRNMSPENPFIKMRSTCRMCFNPANYRGSKVAEQMVDNFSFSMGYHQDVVIGWKFVPYPERWNQA